jgi:hypothetical protein
VAKLKVYSAEVKQTELDLHDASWEVLCADAKAQAEQLAEQTCLEDQNPYCGVISHFESRKAEESFALSARRFNCCSVKAIAVPRRFPKYKFVEYANAGNPSWFECRPLNGETGEIFGPKVSDSFCQ